LWQFVAAAMGNEKSELTKHFDPFMVVDAAVGN
jgi:hypothetical protein